MDLSNNYDLDGRRIRAEFDYAEGTKSGEAGANPASRIAAEQTGKIGYRTSLIDSSLYAIKEDGSVISHMIYDEWGNPQTETRQDMNYAGIDNMNNYTGYTYDEVMGIYFAQARFYDPVDKRFIQEDPVKDGSNWYAYCGGNPVTHVDPLGRYILQEETVSNSKVTIYNQGMYTYKTGWWQIYPSTSAATFLKSFANALPAGGVSYWLVEKYAGIHTTESNNDTSQHFTSTIESAAYDIFSLKFGSKLKGLIGDATTAVSAGRNAIGTFADMSISKVDKIAFDLMKTNNIATKSSDKEDLLKNIDVTYSFIAAYSDYFVPFVCGKTGPSLYELDIVARNAYNSQKGNATQKRKNASKALNKYIDNYYNFLLREEDPNKQIMYGWPVKKYTITEAKNMSETLRTNILDNFSKRLNELNTAYSKTSDTEGLITEETALKKWRATH